MISVSDCIILFGAVHWTMFGNNFNNLLTNPRQKNKNENMKQNTIEALQIVLFFWRNGGWGLMINEIVHQAQIEIKPMLK